MKKTISGESLKKNVIYNICYQILILILPLITAPYISRVLSSDNVGAYSYTQAFANYFVLFAMLGVNNYGNRIIAQVRDDRKKLSSTFWEIYTLQLALTIFVSTAYLLYVSTFVNGNRLIYILQFIYVISAAFDINWFCFGLEKFKITVTRNAIIKSLVAAAIFIYVNSTSDLDIYTFIMASGILVSQIVIWPFVIKQVDFVKPSIKGIVRHIKPNLVLFVPVVAISLYNIMNKIMLGIFSTSSEVGYYDYAQKIVEVPIAIILALGTVMMPRMSNLVATGNKERGKELTNKAMLFAILLSTAFAFGLAGIAPIFTPWFYGTSFARSGVFILWLCPVILFKSLAGIIRTQFIIPNEKDSIYILSITSGAIVNLVTNYFLIPIYAGKGAVIGTVLAEATVCLIQFGKTRHDINFKVYLRDGIILCMVGLVMYLVVHQLSSFSSSVIITLIVQVCVGGVIYMVLAALYLVKIKKEYSMVNEVLKIMHIRFRIGVKKA
ncbi:oligosaccharide flippase family protein [Gottfriedia acidiceleris]|uniref:oligosaccharide flippase family protein n=1 Tax=Gottfriedia acidiceleris TaxID=371036 RepID=UPI00300035DC